eukprot:TRINITY_DN58830_c0_g1_i1.p1 TRINITY_DN58830_c0_g1~~TRINITY_DN58830_c0_g1_i1.p1  ORF type:complete len:530 (-),score=45.80 TRINITY_DN58830_c0_g1_i1:358-1872(-)
MSGYQNGAASAPHGIWETARVDTLAAASKCRVFFGYGSLIWKADFPYIRRFPCAIDAAFQRRFWMKSVDHRGTELYPGRTVTLVRGAKDAHSEQKGSSVSGMAYEIAESDWHEVVRKLDHRERHGYTRTVTEISVLSGPQECRGAEPNLQDIPAGTVLETQVYFFDTNGSGHEEDSAFVGGEKLQDTAEVISRAVGPSGPGVDYLRQLENSVSSELGVQDAYLIDLLALVDGLMKSRPPPLFEALGAPRITAFVGGGGKTTLTFCEARQAAATGKRVIVTTTTKMLRPRVPQDVSAVVVTSELDNAIDLLKMKTSGGSVIALAAGEEVSDHGTRSLGVPPEWPLKLLEAGVADVVVVEADGSRKLPFKAPRAPTEPVLPCGCEAVVAVAGLDVLGSILDETSVCRADVVSAVTGLALGARVGGLTVARVLADKTLWCQALENNGSIRFYAAINKVEGAAGRSTALVVAKAVLACDKKADLAGVLLTGPGPDGRGDVIRLLHHSK